MKIIFLLLMISGLLNTNIHSQTNADRPQGEPIAGQSFDTEFPDFGAVRFASYYYSGESFRFHFYLLNQAGRILYEFPDFYGNEHGWAADEIKAIAFRDVNHDGRKDIIIIGSYITGMGPNAAVPFDVAGVYFQGLPNSAIFIHDYTLNEKINNRLDRKTIQSVTDFVRKEFSKKKK